LNRSPAEGEAGVANEEGAVATQQRRPTNTKTLEALTKADAVSPDASIAELFPAGSTKMATKQPGAKSLSGGRLPGDFITRCRATG